MLEWNIIRIKRLPKYKNKSNIIVSIDWSVSAQNIIGDFAGIVYGKINFNPHDSDKFIEFFDLKKENLLEWIWCVVDKTEWEEKAINELRILELGDQGC